MNSEKILIQSVKNRKSHSINLISIYSVPVLSAFIFMCVLASKNSFERAVPYFFIIFLSILPIALIAHFISKKAFNQANIIVTNHNISISYNLTEHTIIPIHSINSLTTSIYSAICIACGSKTYRIPHIKNRNEIVAVINKLLLDTGDK